MFRIISNKKLKELATECYDKGTMKGYELGYLAGQVERRNKGIIISAAVDEQVDEIMEKQGWK